MREPGSGNGGLLKRLGWESVIVATALVALVVAAIKADKDVDEAAAAVAAAVIAVAGTFIGHKAGHGGSSQRERETQQAGDRPANSQGGVIRRVGQRLAETDEGAFLIAFILVVLTVIVGVVAYRVTQELFSSISPAAAAAIFAAAVGVVATSVAHERWLPLAQRIVAGRAIFAIALVASLVLVFLHPRSISLLGEIDPPDVAAFAAALISVAGTFLAHSAGHRLSERATTSNHSGS